MNTQPAYYTGTSPQSFRPHQQALIVGVVMIRRKPHFPFVPCFHVRYPDGMEDFSPIADSKNYIITQ